MRKPASNHEQQRVRQLLYVFGCIAVTTLPGMPSIAAQFNGPIVTATTQNLSPDATHIAFDVVSIKRSNSSPGPTMIISPIDSDRIIIANASPRSIIEAAYSLTLPSGASYDLTLNYQVSGLPAWANSETYDIEAKVAESDGPIFRKLLPMQRNPMLQSILVNRFHLISHFETKSLPAYALVISRGGPKLKEVQPGILPNGLKDPGGISMSRNQITATGASMLPLLHVLQMQLSRPVG